MFSCRCNLILINEEFLQGAVFEKVRLDGNLAINVRKVLQIHFEVHCNLSVFEDLIAVVQSKLGSVTIIIRYKLNHPAILGHHFLGIFGQMLLRVITITFCAIVSNVRSNLVFPRATELETISFKPVAYLVLNTDINECRNQEPFNILILEVANLRLYFRLKEHASPATRIN